jgi:hypothetical protein
MTVFGPEQAQADTTPPELFGLEKAYYDSTGHHPPRLPADLSPEDLREIIEDFEQAIDERVGSSSEHKIQLGQELDYLRQVKDNY